MHGRDFADAAEVLHRELAIAENTPYEGQIKNASTLVRSFEAWANVLKRYPRLVTAVEAKATSVERAWQADSLQAAAREVTRRYGKRLEEPVFVSGARRLIVAADVANSAECSQYRLEPISEHVHLLSLQNAIRHELKQNQADDLRLALQELLSETTQAVSETDDPYGDSVRITMQFCVDRELLGNALKAEIVGPAQLSFIISGFEWVERTAGEMGIVKPFNWSPFRSPAVWLALLKKCCGPMSRELFRQMHNGEHAVGLRRHPDSTNKSVSLDLDDLGRLGFREDGVAIQ